MCVREIRHDDEAKKDVVIAKYIMWPFNKNKKKFVQDENYKRHCVVEINYDDNEEAKEALRLMESTRENIFLTGRAGTGKSTLINEYFRKKTKKKLAIVAFTGVAALNVRGQTIHSFFGFNIGITENQITRRADNEESIYKKLDVIIIDEISMVRADLMDCIDKFLRLNGPDKKKPFGGFQMIVVGDPYQLDPVVKEDQWIFNPPHYESPFFFDSRVFQHANFNTIELKKIYRQNDPDFIETLDAIRTSKTIEKHFEKINTRYQQSISDEVFYIRLVPTNSMADNYNLSRLARLNTPTYTSQGVIVGTFYEKLPTNKELKLKKGAQVMLLNNDRDRRWVNGDIGKVTRINTDLGIVFVEIETELQNGQKIKKEVDVMKFTWERVKYYFDKETRTIESKTIGSFTQYPIRLAWAITIHKGQGKTYENLIVNFGTGLFAHGQAYVALSRAKNLRGLTLLQPFEARHIIVNARVTEFMETLSHSSSQNIFQNDYYESRNSDL